MILACRDERPTLCLLRDVAWSLESSSPLAIGIPRFAKGITRAIARNSKAWVPDPSDGVVRRIDTDAEKLAAGGLLLEGARTNYAIQSSGKNQHTGWTNNGTGVNSSAIDADASDLLFDADESGYSIKFTAGNPIGADLERVGTATSSFSANDVTCVSFDYKDAVSGQVLSWGPPAQRGLLVVERLDRGLAGRTGVERDAHIDHEGPPHLEGDRRGRIRDDPHAPDRDPERLRYGWPDQSPVPRPDRGRRFRDVRRILTEAAAVARVADQLTFTNNSAARCWNNTRGSFAFETIVQWAEADVSGVNKTFAYVGHDSNNYEWVYYDGTNGRWVFERRVAGTIYRAILTHSPVRGTTYKVVARWTSSEGELGLTNYAASIFIDGVKGTDVDTTAAPTEVATVNLELGSKAALENADAQIRLIHSFQYVATDAEAARMPPQ